MQKVSRFFHLPVRTRAETKTDKTNGKIEAYIKDLCNKGIASNHDSNSVGIEKILLYFIQLIKIQIIIT